MPKSTTDNKTWSQLLLSIDWQADRHSEYHAIEFQRPTKGLPVPEFPVIEGEPLSVERLPMSNGWRHLFATIVVRTFDEYSLTIQYGTMEYTITPDAGKFSLGEKGRDYATLELSLRLKEDETVSNDDTSSLFSFIH